jgi:hypothetical protein
MACAHHPRCTTEWTLELADCAAPHCDCAIAQVFWNSLITSTLFFRTTLSPNSINEGNVYLGVIFFSLILMIFNGFSETSILVARLPVFFKQRDNLFYPRWTDCFKPLHHET